QQTSKRPVIGFDLFDDWRLKKSGRRGPVDKQRPQRRRRFVGAQSARPCRSIRDCGTILIKNTRTSRKENEPCGFILASLERSGAFLIASLRWRSWRSGWRRP